MKRIVCIILLVSVMSCQPRQFQSHTEAVEYHTEKKGKEKRLKDDWKAMGIFSLVVFALYNSMKDRR